MALYKDAKHWFEDNAESGAISVEQMISCILCNLDNDDIERWFGVSMESEDDNPGQAVECPVCGTETNDTDTIADHGMCLDCLHEREEAEDDERNGYNDPDAIILIQESGERCFYIRESDFDYDWQEDRNVYPFDAITH